MQLLQPSLVPRRLAETPGLSVPAVVLDQFAHLLVHTFGEWASKKPVLPLHLDFNEDAVDVLPEAPAVDPLLNVPDPVLRLLGVVVMLDREHDVAVVLLAALQRASALSHTFAKREKQKCRGTVRYREIAVAAAPSKTHDLRSADAAEVILSGSEHSLAVQQICSSNLGITEVHGCCFAAIHCLVLGCCSHH